MKHQVYYNIYLIKLKFKYKKSNFGKGKKHFQKLQYIYDNVALKCCQKQ